MKRRTLSGTVLALLIISMSTMLSNIVPVSAYKQIHAQAKLSRHVFSGVGDIEDPYWQYIYVKNPTRQILNIKSVQIDTYVNGVFHPEISYLLTPDWLPERWNTEVLPFEKSVILYHGWIVGEDELEGIYVFDITVHAIIMGDDIELKTRSTFRVFL